MSRLLSTRPEGCPPAGSVRPRGPRAGRKSVAGVARRHRPTDVMSRHDWPQSTVTDQGYKPCLTPSPGANGRSPRASTVRTPTATRPLVRGSRSSVGLFIPESCGSQCSPHHAAPVAQTGGTAHVPQVLGCPLPASQPRSQPRSAQRECSLTQALPYSRPGPGHSPNPHWIAPDCRLERPERSSPLTARNGAPCGHQEGRHGAAVRCF